MPNDDEQNVDQQLDEQQRKLEDQRAHPLIQNHQNNTRTSIEESNAVSNATGAIPAETDPVTMPNANEKGRP